MCSFYADDKGNGVKILEESSKIGCRNLYITKSFILDIDSIIYNTLNYLTLFTCDYLLVLKGFRLNIICIMKQFSLLNTSSYLV